MKRSPRWLKLLGLLAVGFVVGRYTADPRETVLDAPTPATAVETPIIVDIVAPDAPAIVDTVPTQGLSESVAAFDTTDGLIAPPSVMSEGDPDVSNADDDLKSFVGTWYAETSHGPRLSVLNADGTGVIDAKLDWLAAMFYGQQLKLNVDWIITSAAPTDDENAIVKVEPGTLSMIHTVTSGTPVENVEALTRDFGAVKEYYIRSHTDDEMVLVDPGDGEVIKWVRREPGSTL